MDSKKAKHVIAKVREKKGMSSIADMQTQLQKQLRSEAMRDILNTALLGAGVAGTVRGGQGLWNLLTRSGKKVSSRPGVAPLPVPYRPSFKDENGEEKKAQLFKGMWNRIAGGGNTGTSKLLGQTWAGAKELVPHGTTGASQAASQYGKNYDAREAAQQTLGEKQTANAGSWWKGLGQDVASPFTAASGYLSGLMGGGHQAGKRQASQAWGAGDKTRAAGQQGVDAAQKAYDRSIARMNPSAGGSPVVAQTPTPARAPTPASIPPPTSQVNRPLPALTGTKPPTALTGTRNPFLKRSFVSPAMLMGAGIGSGYGIGSAPEGETLPNTVHHGLRGLGTGAGTSAGAMLGLALAKRTGGSVPAVLAGLLGGGLGGGILGNKLTKSVLGKSPGERVSKEDEQIEVLKQRAEQARQEGDDNYGFSFRKYSADKQAIDMPKPGPTSKPGLWWYMPAMLGAGTLGGYGGWKLIDHILDKRRRREVDDEVDESRNEFQEALMSQYKQGSDSELGVALDELYAKMNKESFDINSIVSPDTRGRALGAYATYAIPSSILGYLLVKGFADKGSRGKILEKAQRRRALKQQQSRPAELYAVPTPIEEEEE